MASQASQDREPQPPNGSTKAPIASPEDQERRLNEARTAVTASLSAVGNSVDGEIRTRAADLHANSAAIVKQEKELAKQTAALAKQSAQYQKLLDTSTKKLNEIGDVQNWAEVMERDLLVIEETMRLVEGKEDAKNASGTGGWSAS
jgi:GCN5-like protein 1 (GCN5L1)